MKRSFFAAALLILVFSCQPSDIIPEGGKDAGEETVYPYYMYSLGEIIVETDNGVAVDSKDPADYRPCTVKVLDNIVDASYSLQARGAIRGRGNSTWNWYPKKPYRIKLDESSAVLGMKKNRDWVLLADYRDVTHMMNNVGFTLAHELGLPYANHSRYVTLTLNGKNMGLYMVTEQVEEGNNRVALHEEEGILLALDINDGPGDVPGVTNNFWSDVFGMAAAVKYPRDATLSDRNRVKAEFAKLERAIDDCDWEAIQKLLDVESMIHYIMIQEIICNVEMDNFPSMRSGFISRHDNASKWVMGPLWDCDGGFSYNWGDMYDRWGWGHTYFESYKKLVFGSDPYNHRGAYGSTASDFFCRLWGIPEFVEMFQARWKEVYTWLPDALLDHLDLTEEAIADAAQADLDLWGINNYSHDEQYIALATWLAGRFNYLNGVILKYPKY